MALSLKKFRNWKQPNRLQRAIHWDGMLDPRVVWLKTGDVMLCLRYLPPDLASSSIEQMAAVAEALNLAVLRFGSRWSLWFECSRNETREYPAAEWPDPVSRLLDEQRRKLFQTAGVQYENCYFITLLYSPASGRLEKIAALYEEESRDERETLKRWVTEYKTFLADAERFLQHLRSFLPRIEPLVGDELVTYLRSCVTTRFQWTRMPALPIIGFSNLLEDDFLPGYAPKLGDHHLRTVKIYSQPNIYLPALLNELNNAEFPLRNVSRWQPLSKEEAQTEIEKRRNLWTAAVTPFATILAKMMFKRADDGSKDDLAALQNQSDASLALLALSQGDICYGYWTHTVTVHHERLEVVEDMVRWVERIVREQGFTCGVARAFDAMPAWIGSIPGHPRADLGKLLASSLSFAKALPSSAPWMGPERDEHLKGPPLLRGVSYGGTPFRFTLHQPGSSMGHILIDGRGGAGKSVLAGEMIWSHRKYVGSRVVIIDYLASAKGVTLALNGDFFDLTASGAVSIQPLADIDKPQEMEWAFGFLLGCLREQGLSADPAQKTEISRALEILATKPRHRRTLTNFQALVQDEAIWDAIGIYVRGGACGEIIDNDEHHLGGGNDVTCFETAKLLENETAVRVGLPAIFHEIEKGLDGRPLLLVVDEAQKLIRYPIFRDQLETWLETARKNNCAIVLITPNLEAFAESELSTIISRSCGTRVYCANPSATEKANAAVYAQFGVTPEQVEIISHLEPAREYFFWCVQGTRRFELALSKVELAAIARNSIPDKQAMDRVLQAGPPAEYFWRWLAHEGVSNEQISEFQSEADADIAMSDQYLIAAE